VAKDQVLTRGLAVDSPTDADLRTGSRQGSWQLVRLENIAQIKLGRTPARDSREYWEQGVVPWVAIADLDGGVVHGTRERISKRAHQQVFRGEYIAPGTLLLSFKLTIGKVGVLGMPAVHNEAIASLTLASGEVDRDFLAYQLQALDYSAYLDQYVKGRTLNKDKLKSIVIALPPLPEQRAIANVLRTVQEAIQARQRELELERERKAALMQHLFTKGTRGEPTKHTEIGEMPESWRSCRLGHAAEVAYGLTVNEARRTGSKLAPYLTVANVTRGALRLDEVKQIGMLEGDKENYRLRQGDVLLVEGNGNPRLLGSAAIWRDELPFVLHQNHLIRARLNHHLLLPDWLMSYLNSDGGRAQLLGKAKTSSGLHSINSRLVADLQIPTPPIEVQAVVVQAARACDAKMAALDHEKVVHEEMFRALLEELMTGQLSALQLVESVEG